MQNSNIQTKGEYANINKDSAPDMWSNRPLYPWWRGSVSEAVLAIGAERNGDVVIGMTYAPLFCNLNSNQWRPDLIGKLSPVLVAQSLCMNL